MTPEPERVLVTGAAGCLGAWVVASLIRDGTSVVALDLTPENYRLRLVLDDTEITGLTSVTADITNLAAVEAVLDQHRITSVIHLAALQVPFCRADPPRGALVNVVGTVNLFEAVSRRAERIGSLVYASSVGVFGPADGSTPGASEPHPFTHYGVFKLANEGTARVYWEENGVSSMGLRPYVIYGVGRDQGVSASPSKAMLAAAMGLPLHMSFGGAFQAQYAPDVARMFIAGSRTLCTGSTVWNLPGPKVHMRELVDAISLALPTSTGSITFDDVDLGLPEELPNDGFSDLVGPLDVTSLEEGVAQTIERLRVRSYASVGRDAGPILQGA